MAIPPAQKTNVADLIAIETPASQTLGQNIRQALLSLSIANLCFIFSWRELFGLAEDPWVRFTADYVPGISPLWALALDIVLLAALLFAMLSAAQRCRRKALRIAAQTGVSLVCALALYQLAGLFLLGTNGHKLRYPVLLYSEITGACALAVFLLIKRRQSLAALQVAFLVALPIFPVLLFNGLRTYQAVRTHWRGNGAAAGMLPATNGNKRVIWVLFDELDRRMLFEARPPRIQIPEFERFRSESIDATSVKSPAMNTPVAVPSLLLGAKDIHCVTASRKGELLLGLRDSAKLEDYSTRSDIFDKVRAAGMNAAVSGWMFPYSRWLGPHLSDSSWGMCGFEMGHVHRALSQLSILGKAWYLLDWEVRALPYIASEVSPKPDTRRIFREQDIDALHRVLEDGLRMVRNRQMNLVFIHLPIPHPPGIWDADQKVLTTNPKSNYLDNLALADRVLGRIRRALEETGDWERSAVLVTTDHPFRPDAWTRTVSSLEDAEVDRISQRKWFPYIPFLLKMPFQNKGESYQQPFNSVLTSELVLKILNGSLQNQAAVIHWLNASRVRLSENADPSNNISFCD